MSRYAVQMAETQAAQQALRPDTPLFPSGPVLSDGRMPSGQQC